MSAPESLRVEVTIVVIDVQEKLANSMPPERMRDLERSVKILCGAAREIGIPVLATEQYPKGLGPTIPAVASELELCHAPRFEKLEFSAYGSEHFREAFTKTRAKVAVLIGMESHVCVYQTARDLLAQGIQVQLPVDGVVSRRDDHRQVGLELCRGAGAVLTTSETLVFDWLGRAGSETFKKISALVR